MTVHDTFAVTFVGKFSSETKVISVCPLITGVFSLLQILALGLFVKTSRTGTGMFSKGMRLRLVLGGQLFGLWPNTCARVGDIVAFTRSGVSERGSTVVKLLSPIIVPSVSSGLMNSWPTIGLKLPFSYSTLSLGEPHTMRCSFEGSIIRRTSALVITCNLTAFLNKVAFRRDNVTFLWLLSSIYCSFSFPLMLLVFCLLMWDSLLRNKRRQTFKSLQNLQSQSSRRTTQLPCVIVRRVWCFLYFSRLHSVVFHDRYLERWTKRQNSLFSIQFPQNSQLENWILGCDLTKSRKYDSFYCPHLSGYRKHDLDLPRKANLVSWSVCKAIALLSFRNILIASSTWVKEVLFIPDMFFFGLNLETWVWSMAITEPHKGLVCWWRDDILMMPYWIYAYF